jgi:hypothetical protein
MERDIDCKFLILRDWIDESRLNWFLLCKNPNAINMLKTNINNIIKCKTYWHEMCENPNAIELIEQHMDKISLRRLFCNPNAIHLIEKDIHNSHKHKCVFF